MNYFTKVYTGLVFLICSTTQAFLNTDVYLVNKTFKPIIRSGIRTTIKKFKAGSDQTKINEEQTIKPNQTIFLFSIPRILAFHQQFHAKTTSIRKASAGKFSSLSIKVAARRTSPLLPTYLDVQLGRNRQAGLIIEQRFAFKFGKIYKELYLIVERH